MRYLLLSVLVVCVIGIMIPSAFAIGESIIKEKDCEIIGKELDPNIECRLVIKNWDEMSIPKEFADTINDKNHYTSPMGYDSDNDLMYFGYNTIEQKRHYVTVEMDNFTIVDQVECDAVTTGTYNVKTTYPCALTKDFVSDVLHPDGDARNKIVIQSKTTIPYQYVVLTSSTGDQKLIVKSCERIIIKSGSVTNQKCVNQDGRPSESIIHRYNTDMEWRDGVDPAIFLNEDKNELYYFMCQGLECIIYLINGMGELKSAAAASEPEPTQSSDGCGEGTELVNGVCQLTKTSGTSQEDGFDVNNLVPIIIPIIGIVSIIALVKSRKKKSSITQPTPEKTKPKPRRKPAESRPTSSSCSNCGTSLKPTAKFCGGCGTARS